MSLSPRMIIRSDAKTRHRKRPVSVAIIDKSAIVCTGLTQILEAGGFRVVARGSGLENIQGRLFRHETNQLILVSLDDDWPMLLTQIKALKERYDGVRVAVLGGHLHGCHLLPLLDAGVDCIFLRDEMSPETLIKSLELVLLGAVIFPSLLLNGFKEWSQRSKESVTLKPVSALLPVHHADNDLPRTMPNEANVHVSAREQAILRLLMRGASNKVIARELDVAEATVKVHVRSVLRKTRASNRTQAAMWAHEFLGPVGRSGTSDPGVVPSDGTIQ